MVKYDFGDFISYLKWLQICVAFSSGRFILNLYRWILPTFWRTLNHQIDHIQDQIQNHRWARKFRKIIQLRRKCNHLEVSTLQNSMIKLLSYFQPCYTARATLKLYCMLYRFPLDNQTFYGHSKLLTICCSMVYERTSDCNWMAICNWMT